MKRIIRAVLVSITFALAACQAPKPIPGATSVAPWQKQFAALDCWNPRWLYDMPSTEPVVFTMVRICRREPIKRETQGWQTVVAVDARTNEVKAVPITSIHAGGVHFTDGGDVVWYSAGKIGEPRETQTYAEAYMLPKGELKERLLGRIDLPFVPRHVTFVKGEGCHVVAFHDDRKDHRDPYVYHQVLVKDDEPFASAKPLDRGRALFWDGVRRNFVLQKEPARHLGVPNSRPLDRYGVDCAGETLALDADLSRRLETITDENAIYVMSRKGDLIVESYRADDHANDIHVYYGSNTHRIAPAESYGPCPDMACAPLYEPQSVGPWSPSGEYFMVKKGLYRDIVHIYRAADMQIVKQWQLQAPEDLPAIGFINDRVVYQFSDHSRLIFQTW